MRKTIKYTLLASFLFPLNIVAQRITQSFSNDEFIIRGVSSATHEELDKRVSAMFKDPVMRNAKWGLSVYDPVNKRVIYSYNDNSSFIPASTTKLLTTDTALSIFGKDYQWTTQLEYSGEIDNAGILQGNLYIIGSGDPSLGTGRAGATTYFSLTNNFIDALNSLGIKRVKGDIILKTAVFNHQKKTILPENIVWKNEKNYFLPVGNTKETDPKNEKLLSKNIDNQKFVYISPHTNKLVYTDSFNNGYLNGKLPDATSFLGNHLKTNSAKKGIIIEGKILDKSAPQHRMGEKRKVIYTYKSPKLEDLVYFVNQTSNNAMSEAFLKISGFYKKGDYSLDTGKSTVNNHLHTNRKFDFNGFYYADGSGLSRSHMVSPISQVKFLTDIMNEPYFDIYFKSLPIAGQSGTLKTSFVNSEAYGQIFAKTGTLNGVKTLAGYVKTKNGKTLVFSLLVNSYTGSVAQVKQKMEYILTPLVNL